MEKRINLNIIDSLKNENGELVIKYKEPKEGEYWYVKTDFNLEYVFIKRDGDCLTTNFCFVLLKIIKLFMDLRIGYDLSIKELRHATEEEKNLLDNKLREQGKFFNQETKQIEKIKEEIKVGDFVEYNKDIHVVVDANIRLDGDYKICDEYGYVFHIESDEYLKKIDTPKPQIGDVCIFWNKDKSKAILSILERLLSCGECVPVNYLTPFENAIPCYHLDQYRNFINGESKI